MKKCISLFTAIAVAVSVPQVATAQTPPPAEGVVAQENGSSSDDRTAIIVGSIMAVLAVGGAAAAGVYWAVQERIIANPLPGIIPNPPKPAAVKPGVAPKPVPAPRPAPAPAPKPAPAPAPAPAPVPRPAPAPSPSAYYANCTAVWNALGRPIRSNEPGYSANEPGYSGKLDRDGDGVGCEKDPR